MTLLAHWKTNEGIGRPASLTAIDSAGGGSGSHSGQYKWYSTLYGNLRAGGPWGARVATYGILGPGGYIDTIGNPSDFRLLGTLTVAGWVLVSDSDTSDRFLASCGGTNSTDPTQNHCWDVRVLNRRALRVVWEYGSGVAVTVDSDANILPVNGWSHIAIVRYEVVAGYWGVKFYVDGSLVSTKDNGGAGWLPPTGGSATLPMLGRTVQTWSGALWSWAGVRVYDTAENDASILAIYNAEDDWLDDTTISEINGLSLMSLDVVPGDPYTLHDVPPETMQLSDNVGMLYTLCEQGPNGIRDQQGFFRGTIFYSHWGTPNTAPYIFDTLPTGEVNDPNTEISFSIGDDRGSFSETGISCWVKPMADVPPTYVLIDGEWQAGFSGTITPNGDGGFDVSFTSDVGYAETLWTVRVDAIDDDGATAFAVWAFEIVIRPTLLSVHPIARRVLELRFDMPVRVRYLDIDNPPPTNRFEPVDWIARGGEIGDAANPANYVITRPTTGSLVEPGEAVPLVPVWVVEAPGYWQDFGGGEREATRIEVWLDDQQTARADYVISVENVESGGDAMFPAELSFVGFQPSKVARGSLHLWDLVGTIHRQDDLGTGELQALFTALQETLDRMLEDVDAFTVDTADIETMRRDFLPVLLWDLGNPFAFDLTPYEQRKLAGVLVDMYRQKGTCVGIINAVRFFVGIELVGCSNAWRDTWRLHGGSYPTTIVPQGGPYKLDDNARLGPGTLAEVNSFWLLYPTPGSLTADQLAKIETIATYMKPAAARYCGVRAP